MIPRGKNRKADIRRIILTAFLVLSTPACGGSGSKPPAFSPPDQWGSFGVGVREYQLVDPDRNNRPLPTLIYYPAKTPPPTGGNYEGTVALNRINAVLDAEPDFSRAPYPLIFFSHGSGAGKKAYKYLLEYLASHGFVCVIADHTGNATLGEYLPADLSFSITRYYDISFVITKVLEMFSAPGNDFFELGDPDRVGLAGHSWGANTALAVAGARHSYDYFHARCLNEPNFDPYVCPLYDQRESLDRDFPDPRVKAVASFAHDGAQTYFGPDCARARAITIPALEAGGTMDMYFNFDNEILKCYQNLGGPAYLLKLIDGGHLAFADFTDEGSLPTERMQDLIRLYTLSFFGYYLKDAGKYGSYLDPAQAAAWNSGFNDFEFSSRP